MKKFVYFMVFLIPFLNQLSIAQVVSVGSLIYLPYVVLCVVCLCNQDFKTMFAANEYRKRIFALFLMCIIGVPTLSFSLFKIDVTEALMYIALLFIVMITLLYVTSGQFDKTKILKSVFWGNTIILLFKLAVNFGQFKIANFSLMLNGERGVVRANFGFSHPNWVAMYAVVEIILLYFMPKTKKKHYVFSAFITIVMIWAIAATGCRTAFFAIMTFAALEIFWNTVGKAFKSKYLNLIYIVPIVYMMSVIITSDNGNSVGGISELTSGRDVLNTYVINYLSNTGNIFFGYGPLSTQTLGSHIPVTDCWYITCLCQFGIVGLIIWIAILFTIAFNFIKKDNHLGMNLLIFLCCYSATENVLYNPGVSITAVIWIVLLLLLNEKYDISHLKRERRRRIKHYGY